MNKKTKIFIIIASIAVLAAGATYYYVMHGGARDLTSEKTDFAVTTEQIIGEFTKNTDVANKKYLEKAITVRGKITEIEGLQIVLNDNVSCDFREADSSLKVGETITVKGRVVGYDDLMGELKLDQCFKDNK
jgi:hypothetical protein